LRVLCRVTAAALYRLAGARFPTAKRAFDALRVRVEHIASNKYAKGLVEKDGGVTIRPVDVGGGR
jgi:hypothetical protein